MEKKRIIVDNPTGLPLASIDEFVLFQGDLKMPITDPAMKALKTSILEHRVFVGKAASRFNGELLTEDGHQTLKALKSLRDDDGYAGSRVIMYKEEGGNMVEDGQTDYDDIMIPYQLIVPQGQNDIERKKDAAAKIAIINSQYAAVNPNTTFFTALNFNMDEISRLLQQTKFPELSFSNFGFFDSLKEQKHPLSNSLSNASSDLPVDDTSHEELIEKEWEGMPEFNQQEFPEFKRFIVKFHTEEDYQLFIKSLPQEFIEQITPNVKSVWFPIIPEELKDSLGTKAGLVITE